MESTISQTHQQNLHAAFDTWRQHLNQRVLGQAKLIDRLLIAVLCGGHLLVEGAPGLAKTRAIRELAAGIDAAFKRIQFTPDLLPGDITGTDIYRPEKGEFDFAPGPIFNQFILADEINRAPAKAQAALLEAMEEKQVSVGNTTYPLPDLFLVMATQNPIEQEGTYPLPEAELDRFLFFVKIDYPSAVFESKIVELARQEFNTASQTDIETQPAMSQHTIFAARQQIANVYMSPAILQYMVELVVATRTPQRYGLDLKNWLRHGASPRASIALDRSARAYAWLNKRDFVTPEDVQAIAFDVLRHRIILSYGALAEEKTADDVIGEIIKRVAVP